MLIDEDIVQIAIHQVGLAVVELIGWTGVHIPHRVPSKWKLRRAGTRLKALETLVRRLITLMALKLDVEPVRPHLKLSQADSDSTDTADETGSEFGGDISGYTHDTVEEISFPNLRQRSFPLLPALMDFSERPDFSQFSTPSTPADIVAKRFTRRIAALQQVLEAPDAHAKRLARALLKIRRSNELKPVVTPAAIPSGLAPEIGILHGGIAFELREALKKWASERPEIDPGNRFQRGRPRQGP